MMKALSLSLALLFSPLPAIAADLGPVPAVGKAGLVDGSSIRRALLERVKPGLELKGLGTLPGTDTEVDFSWKVDRDENGAYELVTHHRPGFKLLIAALGTKKLAVAPMISILGVDVPLALIPCDAWGRLAPKPEDAGAFSPEDLRFLEDESDKALRQTLETFRIQDNFALAKFVWGLK